MKNGDLNETKCGNGETDPRQTWKTIEITEGRGIKFKYRETPRCAYYEFSFLVEYKYCFNLH